MVTVADQLVRMHQLVTEPYLADLEAGHARRVWTESRHTIESKIYGPHFEALAAEWVRRYAYDEAGLAVGPVGQSVIACREHGTGHQLDVLALARGSRPRTPGTPIALIGEAKYRDRRPGVAELRRLEHVRDLLIATGHDASATAVCLLSGTGFTQDLIAEAARSHGRILLVGLGILYGIRDRPA